MPRYKLRTLLLVLASGPLLFAWWWTGDLNTLRFGAQLPVRGTMWREKETCTLQYILAFQRRTALTKSGEPRTTWIIASDEPIDAKVVRRMVQQGARSYEPVSDSIYLRQPYLLISFRSGEPGHSVVWNHTYGNPRYSGKVRQEEDRIIGRASIIYPDWPYQRSVVLPKNEAGYKIWFNTKIEQY